MKGKILFKNCIYNYCYDIVKFVEIIYFIVITIFKIPINFKMFKYESRYDMVSKFEIMEVDSPEVDESGRSRFNIDGLKVDSLIILRMATE